MQPENNFGIKLLSVVMPVYKQEKTIVKDIKNVKKILDSVGCQYELIIVIDGIVDKSYEKVLKLKSDKVKVLSYKQNRGKGHAVRYGMLKAKGTIIGFIDAGMDINPSGFIMLLNHMSWYNADIIVGSKLHPVSKVNYPFYRKVISSIYRLMNKILFGVSVRDTQVGLKFFKRQVVLDVIPKLLVKRFAFDIEILAVAREFGYTRIYEAPVEVNFKNNSTITSVDLWKTLFSAFWDTLAVFYRIKILKYYQ